MSTKRLFFTGGAVPREFPYIARCDPSRPQLAVGEQECHTLENTAIQEMSYDSNGRIVYIWAPRQMGKTSLLRRLESECRNRAWICCSIDLATLSGLDEVRWFNAFADRVAETCKMERVPGGSPVNDQDQLRTFLVRDVGLQDTHRRLALFLDEADNVLDLAFRDRLLMTFRDLDQQQRYDWPGQVRLAFAGTVEPNGLVSNPHCSPFNTALVIPLPDFTLQESFRLTAKLVDLGITISGDVSKRIYEWASGHPHLTQRICELIEGKIRSGHIVLLTEDDVDQVVSDMLRRNQLDSNVGHVSRDLKDLLLKNGPRELLHRLIEGKAVRNSEAGSESLWRTGAVKEVNDQLIVRNRIYEKALAKAFQVRREPSSFPPIVSTVEYKGKVDFGIITIIRPEFEAVLEAERFKPVAIASSGQRDYNISIVEDTQSNPHVCAVVRSLHQGNLSAQAVTTALIEDLSPKWLFLVGIAGGVPNMKFTVGDVLIASLIHDMTVGADQQGGNTEQSPRSFELHLRANAIVANLSNDQLFGWNELSLIKYQRPTLSPRSVRYDDGVDEEWRKKINATLVHHFVDPTNGAATLRDPKFVVGQIASSDLLIRNTERVRGYEKYFRKVEAFEMEAAGAQMAAAARSCPLLVIRGISDIIGLERGEEWKEYACHTAAAFAYALVKSGRISIPAE